MLPAEQVDTSSPVDPSIYPLQDKQTDERKLDTANGVSSTVKEDTKRHKYKAAGDLFFRDGQRRIDFILAWNTEVNKKSEQASEARNVFIYNLMKEGLQIEFELADNSNIHYAKVHATCEVLRRYADILKLRMPIKASQLSCAGTTTESTFNLMQKLLAPFQYDHQQLPPIVRSHTWPYSSSKEYLFDIPDNPEDMFSNATRSWIVDYILRRKYFADNTENNFAFGINKMLSDNFYCAAYPLHEGHWKSGSEENLRKKLFDCWAHWKRCFTLQPIDHVRLYFGETIALYFAWLGFYTRMLIPASIVGVIVFIYGLSIVHSNTVSDELCDPKNNITMCPLCDECTYWKLHDICFPTRVSRIFDNAGTMCFAIFMSLWGTFFLEFWKRQQATIQHKWDLSTFVEEEQPPRPEYLSKLENWQIMKINSVTGLKEPHFPFWRRRFPRYLTSFSVMVLLVSMALSVVLSVIAYKASMFAALKVIIQPVSSASTLKFIKNFASLATTMTAALINLVIIITLNFMYGRLAFLLTDWECLRTQNEYDNSITLKLFVLQFITYYSSSFYIAFFKGQYSQGPGKRTNMFGGRHDECDPAGCLIELCIQLSIIMLGQQLVQNNLSEIVIPMIIKFIKLNFSKKSLKKKLCKTAWEEDYLLEPARNMSLFYEYLEMVVQFGFLTIFCAAFPLGPLIAFLNNIIEIRVDANKFITQRQRPVALKSATIGIWYSVLYGISRLAVVTNAMIIATTSDFIPRVVYTFHYSQDRSSTGYVNFTLAYFNTSDLNQEHNLDGVHICRYKGFKNPPWSDKPYEHSMAYWHILAARLAFVCIFENVVVVITSLLSWIIPDIPGDLRKQIKRESYITNEIVLATELRRAHGVAVTDSIISGITEAQNISYSRSVIPPDDKTE